MTMADASDQFWRSAPPADLAPYVEAILGRRARHAPADFDVFPGAHAELLFHFADPFRAGPGGSQATGALPRAALLGPRTGRCRQQAGPAIDWLIVQLSPAGCQHFLGHPFGQLIDYDAALTTLLPGAELLWQQLADQTSFRTRAALAADWLRGVPVRRRGDSRLSQLVTLSRTRPVPSAARLADILGHGERRLRQRFAAEVGVSPKSWLSLMRANRYLTSLHPATRSTEFEYADDSHAIRAFRRFAGITPGAYRDLKAAGDPLVNTGRNLALEP